MVRRPKRGHINKDEVLEKLEAGRSGAIQVCTEAKIYSDEYEAADKVTEAIDGLAEKLTGDDSYFHIKPSASKD